MAPKIYYAPGSCAFAALAALEYTQADYVALKVDLAAGEQKSDEFRKLNPLGRVPVMVVDGHRVTEAIAILTYIAASSPEAGLMTPSAPLILAREYEMLSWFSTSLHLHIAQTFRAERFADDEPSQASIRAKGRHQYEEGLNQLEKFCSAEDSVYSTGRFRLTNAFGIVLWRWAKRLEIDTNRLPAWSRIIAHDLALPSVIRAVEREASSGSWTATT